MADKTPAELEHVAQGIETEEKIAFCSEVHGKYSILIPLTVYNLICDLQDAISEGGPNGLRRLDLSRCGSVDRHLRNRGGIKVDRVEIAKIWYKVLDPSVGLE